MKKIPFRTSTKLCLICFLLALPLKSFAAESDTYSFSWLDPDKEVYVLQNRKFRKNRKLFAHVGYGYTTSGSFINATNIQARFSFFFSENWGVEALYSLNEGEENTAAESVRNSGGAGSIPFRRITEEYYGALIVWSPFYAKINTFNKILYFDWIIGLGGGKISESNNKPEFDLGGAGLTSDVTKDHTALIWETAFQFYISQSWDVRLDLTGVYYQARKVVSGASADDKTLYNNYDVTLSLGYSF